MTKKSNKLIANKDKMTKGSSPKAQVPTAKITSTKIAPVNLASKPKQTEVKSILVFDIGRWADFDFKYHNKLLSSFARGGSFEEMEPVCWPAVATFYQSTHGGVS